MIGVLVLWVNLHYSVILFLSREIKHPQSELDDRYSSASPSTSASDDSDSDSDASSEEEDEKQENAKEYRKGFNTVTWLLVLYPFIMARNCYLTLFLYSNFWHTEAYCIIFC